MVSGYCLILMNLVGCSAINLKKKTIKSFETPPPLYTYRIVVHAFFCGLRKKGNAFWWAERHHSTSNCTEQS